MLINLKQRVNMKYLIQSLVAAAIVASSMYSVSASAVGSHTVSGHYRSNGTYVQSYRRTNPDSSIYNNYSYGN